MTKKDQLVMDLHNVIEEEKCKVDVKYVTERDDMQIFSVMSMDGNPFSEKLKEVMKKYKLLAGSSTYYEIGIKN
jgi:hypothetical protein